MNIYRRLAEIYAHGPYPGYSLTALDLLPALFERFDLPTSGRLLDIACGEGTFSIAMAKDGWQAAGIDQSPDMIEMARKQADQQEVEAAYFVQDMRQAFPIHDLDLITCWYDSLNYLLEAEGLSQVYRNAFEALKPGGIFLFDMNTLYGLAVGWQRQPCYVQQDASEVFEIHQSSYDHERQIGTVHITAFIQQGELWERIDEVHQERAYPVEDIRARVTAAGFDVLSVLGSLRELTPPKQDSNRVWIVARRPA